MKETIPNRINALRQSMVRHGLQALYISGTDQHRSEYLSEHWQTRRFATGFTGSYGEVLITAGHAGLWTDTRYFLQAEEELHGTGVELHPLRVPHAVPVPEWLATNLDGGDGVGIDPFSLPLETWRQLSAHLSPKNIELVSSPDVLDEVWTDRPPLPAEPVFELPESVTGTSHLHKLEQIREILRRKNGEMTVVTALDDLAWCYNLRGNDIAYNPVFYGFAIIGENTDLLFTHLESIPESLKIKLGSMGVGLRPYHSFEQALETFSGLSFYIDPQTMTYGHWNLLSGRNRLMEGTSIPCSLKSVKNEVELQGWRKAMIQDGIAMTQFIGWLRERIKQPDLTEYEAGRKVAEFRSQREAFRGESFPPIVGYGAHGAIVHFLVNKDNTGQVNPQGVLLIDSGGHYLTGTTDITRTIAVGVVSAQQKRDFTLVLKGMIALSMAVFPEGTRGMHLDMLVRVALCREGLNYGHGTGHGVGHYLCVHEGPASIRMELNSEEIKAGMVFTNEPGLYRTGAYGIRTENMMVVVEKETTEFGRFLGFETLTLCPVDRKLIDISLLTPEEIVWINEYHRLVRTKLSPWFSGETAEYLEQLTAEL